jgi:hypothetical protein
MTTVDLSMNVPILGQGTPPRQELGDPEAKVSLTSMAVIWCSQHGPVAWNKDAADLKASGLIEQHRKWHAEVKETQDKQFARIQAAARARTKMESTAQCQCPCQDHTGCIPEDREHTVPIPDDIQGVPAKALVTCGPCKDYWNWRIENLGQDDQDDTDLRTIDEWHAADTEHRIMDWDGWGFADAPKRDEKVTYRAYKNFRGKCTTTQLVMRVPDADE